MEEDVDKECTRYNSIIHQLGGIDLQLLGIGNNGHIGFNEPSDTFAKETHCVELTKTTIQANARFLIPLMKFLLTHIQPESKILWSKTYPVNRKWRRKSRCPVSVPVWSNYSPGARIHTAAAR